MVFRDTGHINRLVPPELEELLLSLFSLTRSIGERSFARSSWPENGLEGRFGGSLIAELAAVGVN